jgi:hypothetical protein
MNAVVRVAYKLPEDFPDTIGDLIQKLVVCTFQFEFALISFCYMHSVWNRANDWAVKNQVE